MHVGASLRLLRTEAGLSLKSLGQAIGVSSAYLSRVENGHDPPPTADRLRAIAQVFGLPVDLLLDLTGRAPLPASPSLGSRTLLREVSRRGLGPAQIGRVLDFIAREFPESASTARGFGVVDLLAPDRLLFGVRVRRVQDAVELAALRLAPDDAGGLARALNAREQDIPSAVGAGLLLPHSVGFARAPTGCLVLLDTPCPVATPDGAPIRAVFALIGLAPGAVGLTTLARATRLADSDLIDQLAAAGSPWELLRILSAVG